MAQSNSMWGAKRRFYCFRFVGVRVWKRSVLISCLASLSLRRSRPLICFCCFPTLAVIFSFVLACVFAPSSSSLSVFPCSREPSVLVLPSFPWLRYLPLRVRPLPSTSNYYLAPDLFLCTPTTALSICHPAPPSTRVPLCICMIFKKLNLNKLQSGRRWSNIKVKRQKWEVAPHSLFLCRHC